MRYKSLICILVLLLALTFIKSVFAIINCQVTPACAYTTVFKISSLTNAHAEIPSSTNYPYSVCCSETYRTFGNSCTTGLTLLKLSGTTNAHAEINRSNNYNTKICLSSPIKLNCTSTTQNCTKIGYDTCLATLSSSTNAHIADCITNPYNISVCCKSCEYSETNCKDNIDNDCDGLTDCSDPDCSGLITGFVKNEEAQPISSADVTAKKNLITVQSAITNLQGAYNIAINCGNYDLIASHEDYVPETQTIELAPWQRAELNFSLVLGTSCESDCTFAYDNIIHASCEGKNGCTFHDSISKSACDNSQPGWVRDYDRTHYVVCASGAPQPKVEIQASINCASGTLVKVTRIVVYNGKPVKLVVATCS